MNTANEISSESFFSCEEAVQALTNLSVADLARIKQIAKLRSIGLVSMDWEDVVNESISRMLAGSRRWPRSVPFIAFMAQTIRSVASEEWRHPDHNMLISESQLFSAEDGPPVELADISINPIHPEREIAARSALEEIELIFKEDKVAITLLRAMAQGFSPEETQAAAGITETEYLSAQKRIRRCLNRYSKSKEE